MKMKRLLSIILSIALIAGNATTVFADEITAPTNDTDVIYTNGENENSAEKPDDENAEANDAPEADGELLSDDGDDKAQDPENEPAKDELAEEESAEDELTEEEPAEDKLAEEEPTEDELAENENAPMTVIPSDASGESDYHSGNCEDIINFITQKINDDTEGNITYTIRLNENITASDSLHLDFGKYMDRVSFDLNEKTLFFKGSLRLFASEFRNGTISPDPDYPNGASLILGTSTNSFGDYIYNSNSALRLKDIVFSAPEETNYNVRLAGQISYRAEIDNVSINNMTFMVNNSCSTFDNRSDSPSSIFDLKGKLSVNNGLFKVNSDTEAATIRILKADDKQGSLSLNDSKIDFSGPVNDGVSDKLRIIPVNLNIDEDDPESFELTPATFGAGEKIVDVSGALKKPINGIFTDLQPEDIADQIYVDPADLHEGCFPGFGDGALMIISNLCVTHTENDGKTVTEYKTEFSDAIDCLDPDKAKEYEITIEEDVAMTSDKVIPAGIEKVIFTAGDSDVCLETDGHELSYAGEGEIKFAGRLFIKSSTGTGNLKLTPSKGKTATLTLDATDIPASESESAVSYISKVNITAVGPGTGNVELKSHWGESYPLYEIADGNISATKLTVNGRFKTNDVLVTDLEVKKGGESGKHNFYVKDGYFGVTNLTATGKVTVEDKTKLDISGNLTMNSGLLYDKGNVSVGKEASMFKLDIRDEGYFLANDYTMASKGGLYLEPNSRFHIVKNATVYNVFLGRDAWGNKVEPVEERNSVLMIRQDDTRISINKEIRSTDPENVILQFRTVPDKDRPESIAPTPKQTTLFTTDIKTFPLDLVKVEPAADVPYSTVIQVDNAVIVGTEWINIYSGNITEDSSPIKHFMKWSDAITYLNTICQPDADYTIVLSEDVQTRENVTFPSKARSITLTGNNAENPVEFAFLGNTALTTNTTFKNLILVPQTYNRNTDTYDDNNESTISLNGKKFEWINTYSKNKFTSVSGSGESEFILDSRGNKVDGNKMSLTVTKGITVPNLTVTDYKLISETDSLTSTAGTYLSSADIDVKSNISFNNLHTLDESNTISYGEAQNNTFKISGIVDAVDKGGKDLSENINVNAIYLKDQTDPSNTAKINRNAIELHVKYIENATIYDSTGVQNDIPKTRNYGYQTYTKNSSGNWIPGMDYKTRDLVTSAKASPAFFVIGKDENDSFCEVLKRTGNALRVDMILDRYVELYTSGGAVFLGHYRTLQEALNDIDRYADKTQEYLILTDTGDDIYVTDPDNRVNLNMPKQAKKITIRSKNSAEPNLPRTRLYLKDTLTLNSDLELDHIIIEDYVTKDRNDKDVFNRLNINLSGYSLTMDNVCIAKNNAAADHRLGKVTGDGTGKTSALIIKNSEEKRAVTFNGDMANVATFDIFDTDVVVKGQTNIGNFISNHTDGGTTGKLTGSVKNVTKDKKTGKITAVTGNITVTGGFYGDKAQIELCDFSTVPATCINNAFFAETDPVLENGSFIIASAPNANTDSVNFRYVDNDDNNQGMLFKKNGNLVYYQMKPTQVPYILRYKASDTDTEYTLSYCMSFAEAVAEINKLGVKRDYTIVINTYGNDVCSVGTETTPQVITMPQAKNIASLTIRSADVDSSSEELSRFENERAKDDAALTNPYNDNIKLYYTGADITLTCPTTFNNVNLVRIMSGKDKPVTAIKTGGHLITFNGRVTFNTPLSVNGGNNGSLVIGNNATVSTKIGDGAVPSGCLSSGAYIYGSLTGFASIDLGEQELVLKGFKTGAANKEAYTAPSLTVTNMNINGGRVDIGDLNGTLSGKDTYYPIKSPANMTVTNLTLKGCEEDGAKSVIVHGKLAATNLTLEDNDLKLLIIEADREFSIGSKGKLRCETAEAIFITRRNAKGIPYLSIPGTVELAEPTDNIAVTVKNSIEDVAGIESVTADSVITIPERDSTNELIGTDASRQLMTADSAVAQMFTVSGDSADGHEIFLVRNDKTKAILAYDLETEKTITLISDTTSYFSTWAGAIAAIDYRNDGNMKYSIILNDTLGSESEAVTLSMPAKGRARSLTVTAPDETIADGKKSKIYYTGEVKQTCPVTFISVELKTPTSGKNTKPGKVTAGDFNLTLDEVTVSGDVSCSKKILRIINNVTVSGKIDAHNLVMEENVDTVLSCSGPESRITINELNSVNGDHVIEYGRNSKGEPGLEIKGQVMNLSDSFTLKMKDASAGTLALTGEDIKNGRLELKGTKKLFTAPYMIADQVAISIGDSNITSGIVKANGAFWYSTDEAITSNFVKLSVQTDFGPVFLGSYLDLSQAVSGINTFNDPTLKYDIELTHDIADTNITDAAKVSAFTLPADDKCATLVIHPDSAQKSVTFSGGITTYGFVTMKGLRLDPQDSKGTKRTDFDITLNSNSSVEMYWGMQGLILEDTMTMADVSYWTAKDDGTITGTKSAKEAGFIGKISGTKVLSKRFETDGCNLRIKGRISNIAYFPVKSSNLISVAGLDAAVLYLEGGDLGDVYTPSTLRLLAASTIGELSVLYDTEDANAKQPYSYVATAGYDPNNTKVKPTLTVTKAVSTGDNFIPIHVRSIKSVDPVTNIISYVNDNDQIGAKLAISPKTDTAYFVIYSDTDRNAGVVHRINDNGEIELPGERKLVMYVDNSGIVYNVDPDGLELTLKKYVKNIDGSPYHISTTYVKSYPDALALINAAADKGCDYVITFLTNDGFITGSSSYAALTWPKAGCAKSLTIKGTTSDSKTTTLSFTGPIKPNVKDLKVRFENIVLSEGTVKKSEFTPSGSVTPDLTGAEGVEITFGEGAKTQNPAWDKLSDEEKDVLGNSDVMDNMLVFSKVTGSEKYPSNTLSLTSPNVLLRAASVIPDIMIPHTVETKLYSVYPVTLNGNIYLNADSPLQTGTLSIHTAFTDYVTGRDGKFAGYGNTQLTFNGDIGIVSKIGIRIYPYIDGNGAKGTKEYGLITADELKALDAKGTGYPACLKIANVKMACAGKFAIKAADKEEFIKSTGNPDSLRVHKNNGALYVSSVNSPLRVVKNFSNSSEMDSWEAAVAEINSTADKDSFFVIELFEDLGTDDPLPKLDMPGLCENVHICSRDDEKHKIITKASKITLGSDTSISGIDLVKPDGGYCEITGPKNVSLTYYGNDDDWGSDDLTIGSVTGIGKLEFYISKTSGKNYTYDDDIIYRNVSVTGKLTPGKLIFNPANDYKGRLRIDLFAQDEINVTDLDTMYGMISSGKAMTITNLNCTNSVLYTGYQGDYDYPCVADMTVTNAVIRDSVVNCRNMTVKKDLTLAESVIFAGSNNEQPGEGGKVSLANLYTDECGIYVKQDKNGKSQLFISGTVDSDSENAKVTVYVLYNDCSSLARIYDGIVLATAPNADAKWFELDLESYPEGYDTYKYYKSGKQICFGKGL